jgi:predicted TIM-barrel fold metal-dependent hydrolase
MKVFAVVASWMMAACAPIQPQMQTDRTLLAEIRAIRAVDNHCHIPPQSTPLPAVLSSLEPLGKTAFHYPSRLRSDNPEWRRVWRALYGVNVSDSSAASTNQILVRKRERMLERGEGWPGWVLDQSGIDVALVNMPQLPAANRGDRFLFVPDANSLIFPFAEETRATLPATVAGYVDSVIRRQLQQWRNDGAVAVKFSTAYARSLDLADVATEDAARIYHQHVSAHTVPSAGDYKALQDYLFRVVAREAGAAGLVVHVHTGIGADPYFAIAGADPLLLENAVNDPTLRSATFVLIHGGWPFDRQAGTMLIKPNVYVDFSAHTFLRHPRSLAETLRAWLEWYPEKVLFGTDAYPEEGAPLNTWEEMLWFASDSAREALAIALTGMMSDGQITRSRALELARMVLRENAMKLYGIGRR